MRALLVAGSVLYLAMMIAAAVLLSIQGPPWQRRLRTVLIVVLALVALWAWLRIVRLQWGRLRVSTPAASETEESGIWGVGGPGIRTPGSTGITRIARERRRPPEDPGEGDSAA